jgi:hypothetical protein
LFNLILQKRRDQFNGGKLMKFLKNYSQKNKKAAEHHHAG